MKKSEKLQKQRQEYIYRMAYFNKIMYNNLFITALNAYEECYERHNRESTIAFVYRIAMDVDYFDGESQAAVFQEIYDEIKLDESLKL